MQRLMYTTSMKVQANVVLECFTSLEIEILIYLLMGQI